MTKSSILITVLQILFIPFSVYWAVTATVQELLIAIFMAFLFGGIGVSGTYHRLLAHRSYRASRFATVSGSLLGCLSLSGSPLAWAAVHRQHHRATDTELDPHSPYHKGVARVLFLSAMCSAPLNRVPDLLRDQWQLRIHNRYWYIIAFYVTVIGLLDPRALLYAWAVPAAFTWYGSGLVNSWGHHWGKIKESKNNLFLAVLTWGEGWHKNHHLQASSAIFYPKNFLLDLGSLPARLYGRYKN
jgi:stearoyl-CoA desaturase (delta-9 desaturase)